MNGQAKMQELLEYVQSAKVPTGTGSGKVRKRTFSKTIFTCIVCGSQFTEKNYDRERKYCSQKCCAEAKKGKSPWNKGVNMWADKPHPKGTLGMKFPDRAPISDEKRKHLSDSHRGLKYPSKTGDKSHLWKGGVTSENERQRKSAEYNTWRLAVFERDAYTCCDCHKKGGYLHAHHKQKFSDRPDLRFDPQNGETLCVECHAKRHGLVFSVRALNHCPDCGKRIKVGAKNCLLCRMKHTQLNRKKCIECGAVIQKVSTRCRSCAAKINIKKTGFVEFWKHKKSNTQSDICRLIN